MSVSNKAICVSKVFTKVMNCLINKDWRFPKDPRALLIVEKGLEGLGKLYMCRDYADERIIDFVVYQIYRLRNLMESGNRNWNISWCFGNDALAKYKRQFIDPSGKTGINYYIDMWLSDGGLNRNILTSMIRPQKTNNAEKYVYLESEDHIKQRFLNTRNGYMLCQESTTGWTPLSPVCGKCTFFEECLSVTEIKYPEIVRYRKIKGNG